MAEDIGTEVVHMRSQEAVGETTDIKEVTMIKRELLHRPVNMTEDDLVSIGKKRRRSQVTCTHLQDRLLHQGAHLEIHRTKITTGGSMAEISRMR